MTAKQARAIELVDAGHSVVLAAEAIGLSVNEIYQALAERDRRKGTHQTREAG
jgi:prolyl-tRNA editing enzyme YbaK/EbsC (Cys-tRNA(Pro) deacylase)